MFSIGRSINLRKSSYAYAQARPTYCAPPQRSLCTPKQVVRCASSSSRKSISVPAVCKQFTIKPVTRCVPTPTIRKTYRKKTSRKYIYNYVNSQYLLQLQNKPCRIKSKLLHFPQIWSPWPICCSDLVKKQIWIWSQKSDLVPCRWSRYQ